MALFSGKKPKKVIQNRTWYEVLWDYTQSLGVALILALMIKASVVEAYKIPIRLNGKYAVGRRFSPGQ